jgi:hypothetical protein
MKLLQPNQFELVAWEELFKKNPCAEKRFIEQVNMKGKPQGLLELDVDTIQSFLASLVLVDWQTQPVALATHKYNTITAEGCTATIGSLCCVKYPGYKLSSYPLAGAIAHAAMSDADTINARCNPISKKLFEQFGFTEIEVHEDGKSLMSLPVTEAHLHSMPHIVQVALPSFTDGGKYD